MKRAAPLFLLSIFLFNLCGWHFILEMRQKENRASVREFIHSTQPEEFIVVKVPLSLTLTENPSFQLTEADEMKYLGKMYDIASSETKDDGFVYFKCIADTKEEELSSDLAQNMLDNSSPALDRSSANKPLKISLSKLIRDYLPADKAIVCTAQPFILLFQKYTAGQIQACISEIPSPPPQQA